MLVETAWGHPESVPLGDIFEFLLAASLAAVLWPLTFNLHPYAQAARAIFLLGIVILSVSLFLLEPDNAKGVHQLGFSEPPQDLVKGDRFLRALPYLAPVAPLLWSMFDRKQPPQKVPAQYR